MQPIRLQVPPNCQKYLNTEHGGFAVVRNLSLGLSHNVEIFNRGRGWVIENGLSVFHSMDFMSIMRCVICAHAANMKHLKIYQL